MSWIISKIWICLSLIYSTFYVCFEMCSVFTFFIVLNNYTWYRHATETVDSVLSERISSVLFCSKKADVSIIKKFIIICWQLYIGLLIQNNMFIINNITQYRYKLIGIYKKYTPIYIKKNIYIFNIIFLYYFFCNIVIVRTSDEQLMDWASYGTYIKENNLFY